MEKNVKKIRHLMFTFYSSILQREYCRGVNYTDITIVCEEKI